MYLTDFGLAKQIVTRSGATGTNGWVGTLDYVSPEQIRGGRIDARADVYALGGVLHSRSPAASRSSTRRREAKLWAQLREPPPVPSRLVARAAARARRGRRPRDGEGPGGALPERR